MTREEEVLIAIAKHPDCHPEVYKLAADALCWTRRFDWSLPIAVEQVT